MVELWFIEQGAVDHLTAKVEEIQHERNVWEQFDAQLCSLLRLSLSSNLIPMLRSFKTCFSVCKQAQSLYRNDIPHFYFVISEILNIKLEMLMEKFLVKI